MRSAFLPAPSVAWLASARNAYGQLGVPNRPRAAGTPAPIASRARRWPPAPNPGLLLPTKNPPARPERATGDGPSSAYRVVRETDGPALTFPRRRLRRGVG